MTTAHLPVILFGIGHVMAMIFILNSSHGIGVNFRHIDRAVFGCLGIAGLIGLWLVFQVWGQPWTAWNWAIRAYSIPCYVLCLIAFPAVTIVRLFRRSPSESRLTRSETIDIRNLAPLDELVGQGPRSKMLKWSSNDSLRLTLSEWSVSIADLPSELDGLTILHLTDLHFAPTYGRRFFEEAISTAIGDGPEPDIVAITGDFIDDDSCIAWISPVLGRLQARIGKFAILGNHDFLHDVSGLCEELENAGFTMLESEWRTIDIEGTRLAIGGTTAPWGVDISLKAVPEAEMRLLLSHTPDQAYRAARLDVDLMLCGHNHGGQVRLPVIGPILMPSLYSRRFDRGFFRIGKTLMFVGQGLGAKDPLRIGCLPEIARITLRARISTSEIEAICDRENQTATADS